jgi:hypothetical protein
MDDQRVVLLSRVREQIQFYKERLDEGEPPFFFVPRSTPENSIIGVLDDSNLEIWKMRDRADVKFVTGLHAENIFEFLKEVVKELETEKSKDLRCVYMYILHLCND